MIAESVFLAYRTKLVAVLGVTKEVMHSPEFDVLFGCEQGVIGAASKANNAAKAIEWLIPRWPRSDSEEIPKARPATSRSGMTARMEPVTASFRGIRSGPTAQATISGGAA